MKGFLFDTIYPGELFDNSDLYPDREEQDEISDADDFELVELLTLHDNRRI